MKWIRKIDPRFALLSWHKRKSFLHKIVIGNKKYWIIWYNIGEPLTSMIKPNLHRKKVLLGYPRNDPLWTAFIWKDNCRILPKSINEFIWPAKAEMVVDWTRNKTHDFATRQCLIICYKRNVWYNLCVRMGSPATCDILSIIFFGVCNTNYRRSFSTQ